MQENNHINQTINSETPTILAKEVELSFLSKAKIFFSPANRNRKAITAILSILLLTGAIGTGVYLTEQRANTRTQASGATLSLSTSSANPKVGDTFTVAASIDTGGLSASAVALEVKYDPNALELVSGTPGNFLPVVLVPVNSSEGTFNLTVGAEFANPKSGVGILAQIVFKAKTNGPTNISFGSGTAVAAVGQPSNVAGQLSPVQITIGAGSAPGSKTGSVTPTSPIPSSSPSGAVSSSPVPAVTLPKGSTSPAISPY